jgi:hypothetical protein
VAAPGLAPRLPARPEDVEGLPLDQLLLAIRERIALLAAVGGGE